ncbi:monomeric [FeFe] hydrogenase [Marinitoga sp. 1137]|uniref:monomeric [FeFe] hydrogenase n=1 Tax=Marinitoga sp. 1137 TaxID=1545835 RepID=UPI000950F903|nr:monomeric [FeFe] hydrogenase [Marinitoga sp. 1137]
MRNFVFNEVMKIRRQTLMKLAQNFESGNYENILKIPKEIYPLDKNDPNIYRDREILKQRIKILLGMDYEKSKDIELYEIVKNMDLILSEKSPYSPDNKYIQIIKEACDMCPSGRYYVTDLCRNCVAHSCVNVCPRNAITFERDRARINYDICVNCGMCANACSYYAIVKLERPCKKACPVDAITEDENGAAEIKYENCVNCGSGYISCPFGAIETPSDLLKVLNEMKKNNEVIAIFAPSIISQFGPRVKIGQLKKALKEVGFSDVLEVSIGADEVAKEEAELIKNSNKLYTTSCCPAFVEYIKKYQKEFIDNISPALSPMTTLAQKLKNKTNAKIVFIGPCIAKKKEAKDFKVVDYVLTFEELGALFISKKIEPSNYEEEEINGTAYGWIFAKSGGVSEAVKEYAKKDIKILKIDGLKNAKEVFMKVKGEEYNLIEGMACEGGCISGPGIITNPKLANNALKRFTNINI